MSLVPALRADFVSVNKAIRSDTRARFPLLLWERNKRAPAMALVYAHVAIRVPGTRETSNRHARLGCRSGDGQAYEHHISGTKLGPIQQRNPPRNGRAFSCPVVGVERILVDV